MWQQTYIMGNVMRSPQSTYGQFPKSYYKLPDYDASF